MKKNILDNIGIVTLIKCLEVILIIGFDSVPTEIEKISIQIKNLEELEFFASNKNEIAQRLSTLRERCEILKIVLKCSEQDIYSAINKRSAEDKEHKREFIKQ